MVGFRGGVVRLVDYQIVKIRFAKALEIKRNALYSAADNECVLLLYSVGEPADSNLAPQALECVVRLLHKLVCMCKEQRSAAETLCV